jgi:hypothetical protein
MGWWSRGWWSRFSNWLGGREASRQAPGEHAVIVSFAYGAADLAPLVALEDRLRQAIAADGTGEYDGNEVADDGSDGSFFMYGPDADRLYASVKPVLEASGILSRLQVRLRYGEAGHNAPETVLDIG